MSEPNGSTGSRRARIAFGLVAVLLVGAGVAGWVFRRHLLAAWYANEIASARGVRPSPDDLVAQGPDAAGPHLVALLEHENPGVAVAAAEGLHDLDRVPAEARDALVAALEHENGQVRETAILALGRHPGPDPEATARLLAPRLDEGPRNHRFATIRSFAELLPASIPVLREALASDRPEVRTGVVYVLRLALTPPSSNIEPRDREAIRSLAFGVLRDPDRDVRLRMARRILTREPLEFLALLEEEEPAYWETARRVFVHLVRVDPGLASEALIATDRTDDVERPVVRVLLADDPELADGAAEAVARTVEESATLARRFRQPLRSLRKEAPPAGRSRIDRVLEAAREE